VKNAKQRRDLMIYKSAAWMILLFGLQYCGGARVLYDYDTLADFSVYKTYTWRKHGLEEVRVSPAAAQAAVRAVDARFGALGLTRLESGGRLEIALHAGGRAPLAVQPQGYDYWPRRWSWGGYLGGADAYVFPKGALIIDLVDAQTQKLVWRGSASAALRASDSESTRQRASDAVEGILQYFPPTRPKIDLAVPSE
jgi:hypothetical protein